MSIVLRSHGMEAPSPPPCRPLVTKEATLKSSMPFPIKLGVVARRVVIMPTRSLTMHALILQHRIDRRCSEESINYIYHSFRPFVMQKLLGNSSLARSIWTGYDNQFWMVSRLTHILVSANLI